jgi:hypothetical protein
MKGGVGSALFATVIGTLISPSLGNLGNRVNDIFNRPEGQPVEIDLVMQSPADGLTQAFPTPLSS